MKLLKKLENPYLRLTLAGLSFLFFFGLFGFAFIYQFMREASIILSALSLILFVQLHVVLMFYALRQIFRKREKIVLCIIQLLLDIGAFIFLFYLIQIWILGFAAVM